MVTISLMIAIRLGSGQLQECNVLGDGFGVGLLCHMKIIVVHDIHFGSKLPQD